MKFLDGLFETKGAEEVRHATSGRHSAFEDQPYRSGWSTERAVNDGMEKSVIVYKCVDTIATAGARLPVVVRNGGRAASFPEIADHPVAQKFSTMVNEYEHGHHFLYRVFALMMLAKQGVFVEHLRDNRGRLAGLYVLPSDHTFPVPGDGKFVSRYEIEGLQGQRFTLPAEKVIWVRKPHPTDPYSSLTPMEAAGLDVDTNFYARLFNRDFMLSDGRPSGLVAVKGGMADDDIDELRRRFGGSGRTKANGGGRAGEVSVVSADQVSWVDLHTSQRDAQYVESMSLTKKDIMLAFGVPESVMGDASGRTFSNADAEKEVFWEATMLPLIDLVYTALDETTGSMTDGAFLTADVSSVDVLQRNKREHEERLRGLWETGLITADEFREETGRSPLSRPGSRVAYVPVQGKSPVGSEADEKAAGSAPVLGSPAAPEGEGGAPPAPGIAPPAAAKGVGARGRSTRARAEQKHMGPGPHPNGTPQSTHGRLSPVGMARRTISGGGLTLSLPDNVYPEGGYALSLNPEAERSMTSDEFLADPVAAMTAFVEDNADLLAQKDKHFGSWFDTDNDKVYLDVSTVLQDKDAATALAVLHEQRAIFDLGSFETIEVTPEHELERLNA